MGWMAEVERARGMSSDMPPLRNRLELFLPAQVHRLAAFATPFVRLRYGRPVTSVNMRVATQRRQSKETVMRVLMPLVITTFAAVCLLPAPAPTAQAQTPSP